MFPFLTYAKKFASLAPKLKALTISAFEYTNTSVPGSGFYQLGNTTSASYQTVYNNTNGPGWCDFLMLFTTAANVADMQVIVDGTTLSTTWSTSGSANRGVVAIGMGPINYVAGSIQPLHFRESLEVKARIATSGTAEVFGHVGETE